MDGILEYREWYGIKHGDFLKLYRPMDEVPCAVVFDEDEAKRYVNLMEGFND